jgi:NAD(P)H-dependent FMN reductase
MALARLAADALERQGADMAWVDLVALDLPIYSALREAEDFPASALQLKQQLSSMDGLLVVSPEYNGSVPPVLKNAIEWGSRPTGDEGMVALSAYRGKVAAIMSASISPFGGVRGLMHLRQILSTVQMLVIPDQVMIPAAHMAFAEDGSLQDAVPASLVETTASRLVALARALSQQA